MIVSVCVKDKRTHTGIGIRKKKCNTFQECIEYARHFKNLTQNQCLIYDDGKVTRLPIYTTASYNRRYNRKENE